MSTNPGQQWQSYATTGGYPSSGSTNGVDSNTHESGRQSTSSSSPHDEADESRDSVDLSTRRDPPRKRNRAALSCVACRERKIKCNRQIPCDQCTKRGDQDMCFLDPYKRGPPAGQSKSAKVQAQLQAQAEQQAERDARNHYRAMQQQQQTQQPPQPYHSQQQHAQRSHHHGSHQTPPHHPVQQQPPTMPSFPGASLPPMMPPYQQQPQQPASKAGHSAAEFDAIKARLAQLEAVLANGGHTSVSPPVRPTTSPHSSGYGQSPGLPTMSNVLMDHNGSAAASRHNTSAVHANQFATEPPPPQAQYAHRGNSASSVASTPGRQSHREDDVASPSHTDTHASQVKTDSDTEDAAMVLEGLAMSGQGSRKGGKGQGADGLNDVVAKEPKESLMGYVARNRQTDIMLDVSQGGTSGLTADEIATRPACDRNAQADRDVKTACQTENQTLEGLLEQERNGIDVSPAQKICLLLKNSSSLFRPIYGPESLLGFGMGWAFTAAEAAKDLHVKGGECPGSAQREAVLRALIRTLPRKQIADQLVHVYGDRVNFLSGNIVHMPSFRKEVDAFYALETVEKRARVINNVDPGWLAVFMLIITLALRFYPCTPPEGWQAITHLFDGRSIHLYASGARTALVLARYQSSQSLAVLQAILLSCLSDCHAGRKYSQTMLRIAVSNAQEMGLHRLGDKNKQPRAGESQSIVVRREVAKRIWYQLVFKDWSGSVCTGTYSVQDRQFNTPLPGNYNDDDLEKTPLPPPHPRETPTEMSYSLESIEIVKVMKLHTDILTERKQESEYSDGKGGTRLACADASHLDAAYRSLLDKLPSFFAVGSELNSDPNIEIQRWLLQQSIFHHLLRLHRPALSSHSNARTSCVALARSILDTQKKLRSRCTVIDRLMCNLAQSYTAAIVLLLDLLQNGHEQSPAMRTVIRSEVAEALRALHHVNETNNSTEGGIRVLEALLAEEESRWKSYQNEAHASGGSKRKRGSNGGAPKRKELLDLALRIARAAKCESECKSQEEQVAKDRIAREHEQAMAAQNPEPQQETTKDALSRALMEQLLFPQANQQAQGRIVPPGGDQGAYYGDGASAPNSYSAMGPMVGAMYDMSSTVGPNGVEGGNLSAPADNGGFDLSSFLAQYDSPGSTSSSSGGPAGSLHSGGGDEADRFSSSGASSSGYSTSLTHPGSEELHRQNSYSSSESPVNPKQSPFQQPQQQQGGASAAAPTAATAATTTDQTAFGLDAFYNWVLSQGLNGRGQATPTANLGNAAPQQQQQQQQQHVQQQPQQHVQQQQQQPQSHSQHLLQSHSSLGMGEAMNVDQNQQQQQSTTVASELTAPTSVASGYNAIQPYVYLAPFGGPPQNGWSSGVNNSGKDGAGASTVPTTSSSTYTDTAATGLTPLPSSLNMGTPSADASAGAGPGAAGQANFNSGLAGWLSGPGLFDW